MNYYRKEVKNKTTGETIETVVVTNKNLSSPELMSYEELISFEKISKNRAIELCGSDAIETWSRNTKCEENKNG